MNMMAIATATQTILRLFGESIVGKQVEHQVLDRCNSPTRCTSQDDGQITENVSKVLLSR